MEKRIDAYLVATILLWLAAFLIYVNYYDILIPGITDGSYRVAIGGLFVVPSLLLSAGQVLFGAFIIFSSVYLFKGKEHATKSLFTSAVMVAMFSLTYVIFPLFGPFYYIVFATSLAPPHVLEIEIVWTLSLLAVSTLLISRLQKLPLRYSVFTSIIAAVFIMVAAS